MKAMILAAGLGTRLRPLTNDRPKALVTVAGRTLLEIVLSRLRAFGIRDVIVNAHHYAHMIGEYLDANHHFGMRVEVAHEDLLLDTGGGLKNAAPFFLDSGGSLQEPFILHNVDVISTIDLGRMMQFHRDHGALASLAVQDRKTSRPLLFDSLGQLRRRPAGADTMAESPAEVYRASSPKPHVELHALAFSGIHVISPSLFAKMTETGAFSIIDVYVRLAQEGEKIVAFRAGDCYWRDLGRPEDLAQAAQDLADGCYRDFDADVSSQHRRQ